MKIEYPVKIHRDKSNKYFVVFPDLPEAITEGDTINEALANAIDVLSLTLAGRLDEGENIPAPSKIKHTHMISPSAQVQAALFSSIIKVSAVQLI